MMPWTKKKSKKKNGMYQGFPSQNHPLFREYLGQLDEDDSKRKKSGHFIQVAGQLVRFCEENKLVGGCRELRKDLAILNITNPSAFKEFVDFMKKDVQCSASTLTTYLASFKAGMIDLLTWLAQHVQWQDDNHATPWVKDYERDGNGGWQAVFWEVDEVLDSLPR